MVLFANSDNLKACAHLPHLLRYWENIDLKHNPGREEEKEHFCHSFETQNCYQVNLTSFPGNSDSKASAYNAGDLGSNPRSRRSVEKEMATHSSILAWRIPRMEEPGGLQSTRSQRVGHNWATKLSLSFHLKELVFLSLNHIHSKYREKI